MVIQVYAPTVDGEEPDDQFYKDLEERHPRTNTKKNVFIIGNWNAKVGSQGSPGVTGRFGFGVQNEPGQRLTEFYQENSLVIANTFLFLKRNDFTHGHHQMVNTEIKLITFFVVEDEEAVYSQQKPDLELTVAQIISFV